MGKNSKTVLVIGAASGIGKETALGLLERGYRVIAADRNSEKLQKLKARQVGQGGENLFILPMDMTDTHVVRGGFASVKELFGALDALVISAAVHSSCPVEYLPDETIDKVFNVNLLSHIKLVRHALPFIKDGGRIVAVSSIAAGVGIPMESLYSASKAGLEMFYESLSVEIAYRNIKCSLVQPGNVNTGFNETGNDYRAQGKSFIDEGYRRVVAKIDSRRGMAPAKVAKAVITALEVWSPKFCYIVGLNALKAHWAKRLLGRDLALKVLAKFFGF